MFCKKELIAIAYELQKLNNNVSEIKIMLEKKFAEDSKARDDLLALSGQKSKSSFKEISGSLNDAVDALNKIFK
jgi:hypothetical protein